MVTLRSQPTALSHRGTTRRTSRKGPLVATRKSSSGLIAALFSLIALLAFASPALAAAGGNGKGKGNVKAENPDGTSDDKAQGSKSDHDGDAGNTPGTTTEDNDTNDDGTLNNVPDEGDNAHPSGKDRSVEHGKSSSNPNQGKSESDPDGNGNGGYDKPGGSGGIDLADQDGNNGCGNDDDFEDDNNGNCGGKRRRSNPPVHEEDCDKTKPGNQKTCPPVVEEDCDKTKPGNQKTCPPVVDKDPPCVNGLKLNGKPCKRTEVLPKRDEKPKDDVLGDRLVRGSTAQRAPLGGLLPFTGGSILPLLALGLAAMGTGVALVARKKK